MLTPALRALLAPRPTTEIHWGLERIRAILEKLGRPERAFRCVHVGGTNGKGSVAATCEALLRESGLRTGLYTSPHLIEFAERIRIDGAVAEPTALDRCAERVGDAARETGASFFEAATALALQTFAEAGVEIAVLEVGLGGRLDATNVVRPEVAVITNIARDHSEYLGSTVQGIAEEKAGIIKEGTPAVLGPVGREIEGVFARRARDVNATLLRFGRDFQVESTRLRLDGTEFRYRSPAVPDGVELRTPLLGRHQAVNAALALRAVELVRPMDPGAVRRGLRHVAWPGRSQWISAADGPWLLDLAHNAAGAAALAATIDELSFEEPLVMVLAILGDKEWGAMLAPLLLRVSKVLFTIAPSSPPARRWNPEEAARAAAGHAPVIEPSFERALSRARELAGSGTVIVTGSCHTVGDALLWLRAAADRTVRDMEAQANAV